jgi:hypothetical protein
MGQGIDYLSGSCEIELEGEMFSFKDFMREYRNSSFITLADGTRTFPDKRTMDKLDRLVSALDGGSVELSYFDIPLLLQDDNFEVDGAAWEDARPFFTNYNGIASREGVWPLAEGSLRPYQEYGVRWLDYMREYGMGGCLADEMGLGKTIQVIALLRRLYAASGSGGGGGTLRSSGSIAGGSYIWFGISTEYFWFAPFDYGSKFYSGDNSDDLLPDTYPLYNANYYGNFKPSMYFTYTSAQNYTRTLTQGVTLTDTRKQAATYKRTMSMNTNGITMLDHSSNYYRKQIHALHVSDTANRIRGFFRSVAEQVTTGDLISYCRDFLRTIAITVRSETHEHRSLSARRDIADHAGTEDSTVRQRGFIRSLAMAVTAADYAGKIQTWFRVIQEQAAAFGETGHVGDYVRGLYAEAGSMAETRHEGEYYREVEDTAYSEAVPLRQLFIFIRLLTGACIRDYIIGRFLKSKEEVVIKSPVCREIVLESTLH